MIGLFVCKKLHKLVSYSTKILHLERRRRKMTEIKFQVKKKLVWCKNQNEANDT